MMEYRRHARNAVLGLLACAGLCACSRGVKPTSVLRTEDFIADPATLPTAVAPSPTEPTELEARATPPARPVFTVQQAEQGVKDVSIKTGAPLATPVGPYPAVLPSESLSLVDAKIGEINGHPIRIDDMFEPSLGAQRLETIAKQRRMSLSEWKSINLMPPPQSVSATGDVEIEVQRRQWQALAASIFDKRLRDLLQDEVLTAEARAALKPQEQAGLRNYVREAAESRRRATGGSQAELERQLRQDNQTQGRFAKDIETRVLIQTQIEDKFKSRLKTSWKDVRLYYKRNDAMFHPPPQARFRVIEVDAGNAESVAGVREALAAKKPFKEVASLPFNQYKPAEGGLFPDTTFSGEYSDGDFFSDRALNIAARKLKLHAATDEPVERVEQGGKKTLTWVWLEAIIDNTRPLSDPDVQMEITKKLDNEALNAAVTTYIERLKARASFTDIEVMTNLLVDIASERYWPEGS